MFKLVIHTLFLDLYFRVDRCSWRDFNNSVEWSSDNTVITKEEKVKPCIPDTEFSHNR
jgi:hypothetical protein